MSPRMTKPTKKHAHLAKTQATQSESLLSAWRSIRDLATHKVHSEDCSDQADAQADLSLR